QEKADYLFTIKVLPYLVLVKKELLRRERQGEAVYQNPSEITPFLHICLKILQQYEKVEPAQLALINSVLKAIGEVPITEDGYKKYLAVEERIYKKDLGVFAEVNKTVDSTEYQTFVRGLWALVWAHGELDEKVYNFIREALYLEEDIIPPYERMYPILEQRMAEE
ncbi:MAG: hypothetical protein K5694_07045, partial [Bacilli bacterium]|nr:hypothetical protein [Bacilli bacterium]